MVYKNIKDLRKIFADCKILSFIFYPEIFFVEFLILDSNWENANINPPPPPPPPRKYPAKRQFN